MNFGLSGEERMEKWRKKLEEAKEFLNAALSEFEQAKASGDGKRAQDACGKVWLAVVKGAEALFLKRGVEVRRLPKTHKRRRFLLGQLGTKEMRRLFHSSEAVFHIEGCYDGVIDWERLPEQIEDVQRFLRLVEKFSVRP